MESLDRFDEQHFSKLAYRNYRAPILGQLLIDIFHPISVVDVGCGNGSLIKWLVAKNVYAIGIEGSESARKLFEAEDARLFIEDVTKPIIGLGSGFDLAVCINVAEHIADDRIDGLIENLYHLARSVFFVSLSEEYAHNWKNKYHFRNKEKWIKKFSDAGFSHGAHQEKMEKTVGKTLAPWTRKTEINWIIKCSLIFGKEK